MEKKHDFEGRFDEKFAYLFDEGKISIREVVSLKDFIRQELIAVLERAKEKSFITNEEGDGENDDIVVSVSHIDTLIEELKA